MGEKLIKIMKRKIDRVHNAQNDANLGMKEIFPKGKRILFKRANMKKATPAIVIWARMIEGCAELRITNTQTSKDRTISFDNVVST